MQFVLPVPCDSKQMLGSFFFLSVFLPPHPPTTKKRSASEMIGGKLHHREGNSPDHQLRPLNDRSVIKEVSPTLFTMATKNQVITIFVPFSTSSS